MAVDVTVSKLSGSLVIFFSLLDLLRLSGGVDAGCVRLGVDFVAADVLQKAHLRGGGDESASGTARRSCMSGPSFTSETRSSRLFEKRSLL